MQNPSGWTLRHLLLLFSFFKHVSYDNKRETELHHVTELTQVSIFSHTSIARNPKTGSEIVESGAFFSELHARIEVGAFQWISSRSALCFIQLGLLVLQSWSGWSVDLSGKPACDSEFRRRRRQKDGSAKLMLCIKVAKRCHSFHWRASACSQR